MYKSISMDPVTAASLQRIEKNPDGSYIEYGPDGKIVSTCDVLGIKREYAREPITGRLMVKRFGTWVKPQHAQLEPNGTLIYVNGDVQIEEHLNGVHVQANKRTGVVIQNDQVDRCELVKQRDNEFWKRHITDEVELFEMWVDGKLSFRSETFAQPCRRQAATPAGVQPLVYVSRAEQSCSKGKPQKEKFTFQNPLNQQRDVTLSLTFGSTVLMLKNVCAVVTEFDSNGPVQTTYTLKGPTRIRVEHEGSRKEYSDIISVCQTRNADGWNMSFERLGGQRHHLE